MKTALLTYDILTVTQPSLAEFLDTQTYVRNWHAPYAGSFLVVLHDVISLELLCNAIRGRFPGLRFVVASLTVSEANGWMPPDFWKLATTPVDSGKWPAQGNIFHQRLVEALAPPPPPSKTMGELLAELSKPINRGDGTKKS